MTEIIQAETAAHLVQVRMLLGEYAASLPHEQAYEHFEEELASLPGAFGPPTGCLLLATHAGHPVGCVALRWLEPGICEMKRLYVQPSVRGLGLGRQLVARLLAEARHLGYTRVRLDTLASMAPAQTLYQSFGFTYIPRYNDFPFEEVVFMECVLR
jgi:GNAT superfamily N-acetyltransferase